MLHPAVNFCCACGAPVVLRVPMGDTLPRHVCDTCGAIHYRNPRLIAGTVPYLDERVLLCRRAIEPRHGLWTLPAGFMENGETLAAAAARETAEEAGAAIVMGDLFSLISVPHVDQVHAFFAARLVSAACSPGAETLEAALFSANDVPWDAIAFRTVTLTLRHFFADLATGRLGFHVEDILTASRA